MSPIGSQLIHLLKSIHLQNDGSEKKYFVKFIAGERLGNPFSGVGLTWWYTKDTFRLSDIVSVMLIKDQGQFKDCDPESVSEVIMSTLQEIAVNQTLFDVDAILFAKHPTLFECRIVGAPDFVRIVLGRLQENLRSSIGSRCTVHALPRFKVESFCLPENSLRIISKGDHRSWKMLAEEGYLIDFESDVSPMLKGLNNQIFALPEGFDCALISENSGAQKGSRFNSILQFRKLVAVLFAVASQNKPSPTHKSSAQPFGFCVQFPHKSNPDLRVYRNDCAPIAPYYASDVVVDSVNMQHIHNWFKRVNECSDDVRAKIEKGAHFLNRAMNSSDIEGYLNFFIVLDAIFGSQGMVESSITRGVRNLKVDQDYVEKIRWLFKLRNEIVHGGSRYIGEWSGYADYLKHFQSRPQADIEYIAQQTVLQSPFILH